MIRRGMTAVLLVVVLSGLAAAGWAWFQLHAPYSGWEGNGVTVDLPRGLSAGEMLERLQASGVLRHSRLLKAWIVLRGGADDLQAGEYRFEQAASPLEVLGKLERGDVLLHPVTLPEGFDLEEIALHLSGEGFGEVSELLAAFGDSGLVSKWDPEATTVEGYLFPDTYHLPRGESPRRIAQTMVERFEEVTGGDYAERAAAVGLTVRQAVTLASMIERETSVADERWRISRVFHNRLERRMKLQCDPTVIYALKREGRSVERLSYRDLEFESPWNTYRVYGLPPGPICNAGRESLDAAVNPAEGEELYFVASPDGGHTFSPDLRSHLVAVREWRKSQRSSRASSARSIP